MKKHQHLLASEETGNETREQIPMSLNALDGLFSFEGRLNRLPYFLITQIAFPIAYLCIIAFFSKQPFNFVLGFLGFLGIWSILSANTRRLHDIGLKRGFKCKILVVIITILPWFQWFLFFWRSDPNRNEWGMPLVKLSTQIENPRNTALIEDKPIDAIGIKKPDTKTNTRKLPKVNNSFVYFLAIISSAFILGGAYYMSESNKQAFMEKQQQTSLQAAEKEQQETMKITQKNIADALELKRMQYVSKRKGECYALYEKESKLWNNVEDQEYDTATNECVIYYRGENWKKGDERRSGGIFDEYLSPELQKMDDEKFFSKRY